MALVTLPRQYLADANGRPRVGAKAYFYQAGTTTEITVYQDPDFSTAHTNPVETTSDGLFPAIYINPAVNETYKVVIKDADDVEIYSSDDVPTLGPPSEPFYETDTQETTAFITPQSFKYPPGHVLRYIPKTQHADILAGTSTYDASADLQDWLDALRPGMVAIVEGFPRAQGLLLKTSDIQFTGGGWIRPVNDATATVLTIGDDSDDTLVRRISGHLRIGDTTTNYTDYPNITGLKLVRCVEFNLGLDITACGIGLDLAPTESAVAYNLFRLGFIYNNKIGIRFNPSGSGYSNENVFLKGRFSHFQALSGVGLVAVQAITNGGSGGAPDNNIFYGPTFEMAGKSVHLNGGDMFRFRDVRFEPQVDGTAGVDFEEVLIDIGANSTRCTFEMSMNTEILSSGRSVEHGDGTRVDDYSFTIAGDLRGYFYPGAIMEATVGGSRVLGIVRSSSYSDPNTTVVLYHPVITNTPSDIITPRIKNLGAASTIRIDRFSDDTTVLDYSAHSFGNQFITLNRSAVSIQSVDNNRPALTLTYGSATTNNVLVVKGFTGETAYIKADGSISVTKFGLATTPVAAQSITGATDSDKIDSIISALVAFGLAVDNTT